MNKFTHITNVIIFSKRSFGELTPKEIRMIVNTDYIITPFTNITT